MGKPAIRRPALDESTYARVIMQPYTKMENEVVPVKKKTSSRTWMRFDASGNSEILQCDKNALLRRVAIPARDLRILGPIFSQSSHILGEYFLTYLCCYDLRLNSGLLLINMYVFQDDYLTLWRLLLCTFTRFLHWKLCCLLMRRLRSVFSGKDDCWSPREFRVGGPILKLMVGTTWSCHTCRLYRSPYSSYFLTIESVH